MPRKVWASEAKLEIMVTKIRITRMLLRCAGFGVNESPYYKWRSRFLEGDKKGLVSGRSALSNRERQLLKDNEELKITLGELIV